MITRLRSPSAVRAEQVRDEAEEAAVARAHVEDRLDRASRGEPRAHRDVRHPCRRARAIGDVDDVDAAREQLSTCCLVFVEIEPGGAVSSTDTANSPRAIRAPSLLRVGERRSSRRRRRVRERDRPIAPGSSRGARLVDRLAAQHAHRAEHRARVLRRRAAAAADQAHAALQHPAREHAEVLGVRDVERAALDGGGQAGVRLRDHRLAAADHADDDLVELGRADAAVAADDVGAGGDQAIRDLGRAEAAVGCGVRVEHHHRDHRHARPALLRDLDRDLHLEDRRERLEHDRVDAGEHQRVDLLGEREPREPALRRARDAELDAGRADRAGDVRAIAGAPRARARRRRG